MRKAALFFLAVAAVSPSSAAWAQATATPPQQAPLMSAVPPGPTPSAADASITQQSEGELLASDLVSQMVYNMSGNKLGQISDLLLDRDHKMKALVITLDGNGQNKKQIAIAFDSIRRVSLADQQTRLVANVTDRILQDAKPFESMSKQVSMDDNQDLTRPGVATGGSVPPSTK